METLLNTFQDLFRSLENNRFTVHQFNFAENIRRTHLRKGDIILTKSSGLAYQLVRQHYQQHYDHVALVVDEHVSLHISYPSIRFISTNILLMKHKQPKVLRLKSLRADTVDSIKERILWQSNKDYDYRRLFSLLVQRHKEQPQGRLDSRFEAFLESQSKNICSEVIMWHLCREQEVFRE